MNDDAGMRTVREVFDELQIDAEWSKWSDRGFTWWPHRLAQRVWSEVPREDHGFIVTRVNSETDLFSVEAQDWRQAAPAFETASQFASMSGFLWSDGVVRLRCSMWVHDENQAWVSRVFRVATMAQGVSAEDTVVQADQLTPHESGTRTAPDDMLNAVEGLPGRDESSAWVGNEMETVAQMLSSNGVMSIGTQNGLTAEFPYGKHGGTAVLGGTSNLLRVSTEDRHPSLGSGMLMRLSLQEHPSHEGERLGATRLNQLELQDGCQSHFLGSWCANPSGGPPDFVSFLPNILRAANLLTNLVMSMGIRSRWASDSFSG